MPFLILCPRFFIEGNGEYVEFSDNNKKTGIIISPKYRVINNSNSSFDAELSVDWHGFSEQLNNGYYSPKNYRSYNIPLVYSQQFGKHNAVFSISPCAYKDNNVSSFKLSGVTRAEMDFKVSEVMSVNMHADIIRSGVLTSSEYEQRLIGVKLKRSF